MPLVILLAIETLILYLLARRTTSKIFNLIFRLTKKHKLTTCLFALLFLPGTFVHEMSHFLFALFLLVPVGQIELMPEFQENGIKMGSVPIGKTDLVRRSLIGVAPIILGLAIILGSIFFIYQHLMLNSILALVIIGYLSFEVGNTMFSSKKDLEGIIPFLVILALFTVVLYLLGVRINLEINSQIFKLADLFLLVPIAIDCLVLLLKNPF